MAEAMIKAGVFDCFKDSNRREKMLNCAVIMEDVGKSAADRLEGQLDFFSSGTAENSRLDKPFIKSEEYTTSELLEFEHEALGMYLSAHPLDVHSHRGTDHAVRELCRKHDSLVLCGICGFGHKHTADSRIL